jgi:hypothetical protein
MRKRKRTGAMLSPCRTPTVCGISTTLFSILSTVTLSLYIVLIVVTNFGGHHIAQECAAAMCDSLCRML